MLLLGILYSTRLVLVEVHSTIAVIKLPCMPGEDPREEYHVATTGVDTSPGSSDAPFLTLQRAQAATRCAHSKRASTLVTVHVEPGEYRLASTLELDELDSHVAWRAVSPQASSTAAVAPPILTGGERLTLREEADGWGAELDYLPDAVLLRARTLYVNGRRASRTAMTDASTARGGAAAAAPRTLFGQEAWSWYEPGIPKARREYSVGFVLRDPVRAREALAWPQGAEFVFSGVGGSAWSESRCGVAGVSQRGTDGALLPNGSVLVTMAQPCFRCWAHKCLRHKRTGHIAPPTAIVNVGRAYLRPGRWWLSTAERRLYYRPMAGEVLHQSVVVLPILERLVAARGGRGEPHGGGPVVGVSFEGFTFRHAAWLGPSTGVGYIEDQSGVGVACVMQAKDVREIAEARRRGLVRRPRALHRSHANTLRL